VPLERPSLEALVLPDQAPLKKRRADVLRVTTEAIDRAEAVTLSSELAQFAEAFTSMLESLTDGGGVLVALGGSVPRQVTEAVKLGAAFAERAELLSSPPFATVDPVTASAKNFASYRHTHFEPKNLGVMAYFSMPCGFYLPLAGAKAQDVLPPLAGVLDAANRAAPAYDAATAAVGLVWDNLVGG
jgi:hypothetical protein